METKNEKTIAYPYLPEGRTILYVDINNKFMTRAREVARGSNDQQQPTGAVIVENGLIISEASNRNPLSSIGLVRLHKNYCIRHLLKIPSGDKYWLCPGCAKKEDHAEFRAIEKFLKTKIPKEPLDIYLWGHWWCCDVCWNNMLKLSIRDVYLLEGSEKIFNLKSSENILGKQFE